MKIYYISHANDEEKEQNIKLWKEIKLKGEWIYTEYDGDYSIELYKYNNKKYELWTNIEYGIMSEIREKEEEK